MEFTTYAERIGERRGVRKGKLQGKQESLLQILQLRFKKVPQRVADKVSALTNASVLTQALEVALRCNSLKEFEAQLPTK